MLPLSIRPNHHFLAELERLTRHNKTVCCFTQPYLFGQPVDLQKLYNEVAARGGHRQVTSNHLWGEVYLRLGFPSGCIEAGHGLRSIYQRYLEAFERSQWMASKSTFVSDDIEPPTNADSDAQGVDYNICKTLGEDIPNHLRTNWKLSTELVDRVDYGYLEYALASGLPNEVDFALNAILLMSSQPDGLHIHRNHRLLDLLLSSVGIHNNSSDVSRQHPEVRRFTRFWDLSISDICGRRLLTQHTCGFGCDITTKPPCYEFSYGDNEGYRIQLVATVLRNLVIDSGLSAMTIGRNLLALQFIFLCSYADHCDLKHLGLETLSSLHFPVVGTLAPLLHSLLPNLLLSSDRNNRIRGLLLVKRLCESPVYRTRYDRHRRPDPREYPIFITNRNVDFLLSLPRAVFQAIIKVLCLRDLHLVVLALDTVYLLSCLGLPLCLQLLQVPAECDTDHNVSRYSYRYSPGVHSLLTILVTLINLEAQAMGSESLIRVRVMQALGTTGSIADKAPPITPSKVLSDARPLPSVTMVPISTGACNTAKLSYGLPQQPLPLSMVPTNLTSIGHIRFPIRSVNQSVSHSSPSNHLITISKLPTARDSFVHNHSAPIPRISPFPTAVQVPSTQHSVTSLRADTDALIFSNNISIDGASMMASGFTATTCESCPSKSSLAVKMEPVNMMPRSNISDSLTTVAVLTPVQGNHSSVSTEARAWTPVVSLKSTQQNPQLNSVLPTSVTCTAATTSDSKNNPVYLNSAKVDFCSKPSESTISQYIHKTVPATHLDIKSPGSHDPRREFMYDWLRNNYAVHPHSSISRVQIYTEYQKAHQKRFGAGGAVLPVEFHTEMKSVFPSTGQVKVQMPGGAVEIHYNNLKHIDAPEPESQQGVNDIMASVLSPRKLEVPPQPRPSVNKSRKRASSLAQKFAPTPTRKVANAESLKVMESKPTKQACRGPSQHDQLINGHINGKDLINRQSINGISKDCARLCSDPQTSMSGLRPTASQVNSSCRVPSGGLLSPPHILPADRSLFAAQPNCPSLNELISKEDSNPLTLPLLACVSSQNSERYCNTIAQTTVVTNLISSRTRPDSKQQHAMLLSVPASNPLPTLVSNSLPSTTADWNTGHYSCMLTHADISTYESPPTFVTNSTTTNSSVPNTPRVTPGKSIEEYRCRWASCDGAFLDTGQLVSHVLIHVPPEQFGTQFTCRWKGCTRSSVEWDSVSLAAHLSQVHCSTQQRKPLPPVMNGHAIGDASTLEDNDTGFPVDELVHQRSSPTIVPIDPLTPADTWWQSPDSCLSEECRRALAGGAPNPTFLTAPGREGPVTKHIRLTAALALRNLLKFSPLARKYLVSWEEVLCDLAFAGLESSPTIHECLTYLYYSETNDSALSGAY